MMRKTILFAVMFVLLSSLVTSDGLDDCRPIPSGTPMPFKVSQPCLSVDLILQILTEHESPIATRQNAESFFNHGRTYGIDPTIALAFFRKESNFGKAVGCNDPAVSMNPGNIKIAPGRCTETYFKPGPQCTSDRVESLQRRAFCKFSSWDEGIEAWYKMMLADPYIAAGRTDVDSVFPTYTPSTVYAPTVRGWVNEWRQRQSGSGAVSSTPLTTPSAPSTDYVDLVIALDDAGGSFAADKKGIDTLVAAGSPGLTIAIMPRRSSTKLTADYLTEKYPMNNYDIVIHQPMEYLDQASQGSTQCQKSYTERARICNRDTPANAKAILTRHISDFSGFTNFVGWNNHQGSLVTGNRAIMETLAGVAREKNLLVLDSWTGTSSQPSVAYEVMQSAGVKSYRNVKFLDNTETVQYTLSKLKELEALAVSDGFAVGIGHLVRETTPKAIAEYVKGFTKEGDYFVKQSGSKKIRLVPLSKIQSPVTSTATGPVASNLPSTSVSSASSTTPTSTTNRETQAIIEIMRTIHTDLGSKHQTAGPGVNVVSGLNLPQGVVPLQTPLNPPSVVNADQCYYCNAMQDNLKAMYPNAECSGTCCKAKCPPGSKVLSGLTFKSQYSYGNAEEANSCFPGHPIKSSGCGPVGFGMAVSNNYEFLTNENIELLHCRDDTRIYLPPEESPNGRGGAEIYKMETLAGTLGYDAERGGRIENWGSLLTKVSEGSPIIVLIREKINGSVVEGIRKERTYYTQGHFITIVGGNKDYAIIYDSAASPKAAGEFMVITKEHLMKTAEEYIVLKMDPGTHVYSTTPSSCEGRVKQYNFNQLYHKDRGSTQVDKLILHHTGGSTWQSCYTTLKNRFRSSGGLGIHYIIAKDGTAYYTVDEKYYTRHITCNWNKRSIGIEIVNSGRRNDPYTKEQYETLRCLIPDIASRWPGITVSHESVMAHYEHACPAGRKWDPSPNFNWCEVGLCGHPPFHVVTGKYVGGYGYNRANQEELAARYYPGGGSTTAIA